MVMMKKGFVNVILGIILLSLLVILFISVKNIFDWFKDNKKTKEMVEVIKDNTNIEEIKDDEETGLINVDLNDLRKINEDTVGYVKVNNTNINYPVVQSTDNTFYLSHTFDKSENKAGWVFMDYRNHNEYFDTNTVLYAHGRLDNTMFGSLRKVIKEEWYTNSDNHIIQYSNDYYSTMWQVFSIYRVKETNDYIKIGFNTDSDYQQFIDMIKGRSIYDFGVDVSINDKIITLSSCYNDTDRMVLHAKLVKIVEK